jgi:hypothetical protein
MSVSETVLVTDLPFGAEGAHERVDAPSAAKINKINNKTRRAVICVHLDVVE